MYLYIFMEDDDGKMFYDAMGDAFLEAKEPQYYTRYVYDRGYVCRICRVRLLWGFRRTSFGGFVGKPCRKP